MRSVRYWCAALYLQSRHTHGFGINGYFEIHTVSHVCSRVFVSNRARNNAVSRRRKKIMTDTWCIYTGYRFFLSQIMYG